MNKDMQVFNFLLIFLLLTAYVKYRFQTLNKVQRQYFLNDAEAMRLQLLILRDVRIEMILIITRIFITNCFACIYVGDVRLVRNLANLDPSGL